MTDPEVIESIKATLARLETENEIIAEMIAAEKKRQSGRDLVFGVQMFAAGVCVGTAVMAIWGG